MIYNKVFENVFTFENGFVTHVDFDLLEQETSNEYVQWLSTWLVDLVFLIKGVFATHEFLVLILTNPLKDDFRVIRLSLTGSYSGETTVDSICLPELEMIFKMLEVTK